MNLVLSDSTVAANHSNGYSARIYRTKGAGLSAESSSSVPMNLGVTNVTFTGNLGGCTGGGFGGGLAAEGLVDAMVTASEFTRNKACGVGGGLYFDGHSLVMTNSLVANNRPGGILLINLTSASLGSLSLINSTITRNRGAIPVFTGRELSAGGGLYANGGFTLDIRNAIIWGNGSAGPDLDLASDSATFNVDHSDIGTHEERFGGTFNDLGGNIGADPLLLGTRDILHLSPGSPCIDTGTCAGAPTTDFEGDPRPTGASCDMGADEFVP